MENLKAEGDQNRKEIMDVVSSLQNSQSRPQFSTAPNFPHHETRPKQRWHAHMYEQEAENEFGQFSDDEAHNSWTGRDRKPFVFRAVRGNRREEMDGDLSQIKMSIPAFQGRSDPEAYLEWEKKMELIFDYHNYLEEKKVKLAVVEFTDYAVVWWGQLVTSRRQNLERPISTWAKLKGMMRKRFVPGHYFRDIYQKL